MTKTPTPSIHEDFNNEMDRPAYEAGYQHGYREGLEAGRRDALGEAGETAEAVAQDCMSMEPVTSVDEYRHDGAMMASRRIRKLASDNQDGDEA